MGAIIQRKQITLQINDIQGNIKKMEKIISDEVESKHFDLLINQMSYLGNGLYGIGGTSLISADTRELILRAILVREDVKIKGLE